MKKICFILTSEFALKAFMLNHLRALSKSYEITVIVNTNKPNLLFDLGINARIIPLKIAREISLIQDLICLLKLINIFYVNKFDSVHTVTPKAGLLGILAAKLTAIKIRIHTFQGEVWITRKGFMRWLLKHLDKLVAIEATHITVVSSSERDFLLEHKILTHDKSRVFNHGSIAGVDLEKFVKNSLTRKQIRTRLSIGSNDIVILYIGRINKDKGILDLVSAFSQIEYSNCHLLIVGPDEHNLVPVIREELKNKLSKVHFFGETDVPQNYMMASDIVSLPSYREGFGLVLIESAACGVTSVASNIYGISDAVIDTVTGLLHEPGNMTDLKVKLETLIDNPEMRHRLSENAQIRVEKHFDSNILTSSWVDFYRELFHKNG